MTMDDLFRNGFEPVPEYSAGPGDYSREIDVLHEGQVQQDREIRRILSRLANAFAGDMVRATSIQGTIPVANGGSGAVGSVFGAVSMIQQNSGGTLTQGAVVVRNGDRLGTTTTTARNQDVLGAIDDASVATGADARIRQAGYQAVLQVTGTVTAGDYLATSTVAGKAASVGTLAKPGVFARAMTADAGGVVSAWLFPAILAEETAIEFMFDGGGSALTTGIRGDIEVAFDCTVVGWTLVADQSGSIVIDVWRDTFANFPPTVADTIAGSEKPTLAAAVTAQDLALSSWATSLTRGEWLRFNIDSAATVTRVTLSIRVVKR